MADYIAEESSEEDYGYGDYGDAVESLEVTFGWVEVNVPDYTPVGDSAAASRIADAP